MNRLVDIGMELLTGAWLFRLLYGVGEAIAPAGVPRFRMRYRDGRCVGVYGSVPVWVLRGIEDTLEGSGVKSADIKVGKTGRIFISKKVPVELGQRIRNLVASA